MSDQRYRNLEQPADAWVRADRATYNAARPYLEDAAAATTDELERDLLLGLLDSWLARLSEAEKSVEPGLELPNVTGREGAR